MRKKQNGSAARAALSRTHVGVFAIGALVGGTLALGALVIGALAAGSISFGKLTVAKAAPRKIDEKTLSRFRHWEDSALVD